MIALKNRPARKLPHPSVINRLYWFDGLTQKQIAAKYGVSLGTIAQYMIRHKIPGRRRGRWVSSQCKTCGQPACQVRVGKKAQSFWSMTSYCLFHFTLRRRAYMRDYFRKLLRKKKAVTKPYKPRKRRMPIQETSWIQA